jgi:xanthine/uracil permease
VTDNPQAPELKTYYPQDRIPLTRVAPMGHQHAVVMFGGTVLTPILMGFSPQMTFFFSGIRTLIFILVTSFP